MFKKYKKILILALFLVFLVGCRSVIDPETKKVLEQFVIRLGDKWPWGQEGYGWFALFIIWPVAQLFNFVASYTGAFWSIIIVTIIIDLVKLRSTINSTIQQQKIQALQPDVNRIKEKYKHRAKDDRQAQMQEAQEIQKLYEKNEINMFGSMIPMLIQLPLLLAVFQSVQRADLIIHGSFLGHDFSGTPSQGFAEMNWVYITIYVVMVIIQALSMFLPQYLQKRKNRYKNMGQSEGPNTQGMMVFSLGMITIFAFTWNIGMSVYWGITALTRLIQTLYINYKYVDKK
ncbi:MAG TPA: membrane protein insertase YidC [Erysipelothrix sp.]|nr:membrane protein insertase YidC [Erysipelothrix sp.]